MHRLVFMIDLDNTILDNDGVKKDMQARLLEVLGAEMSARYWELYEVIRKEKDFIDFINSRDFAVPALARIENCTLSGSDFHAGSNHGVAAPTFLQR